MSAIDAALEMVAVVFLLAAMVYSMKLIQLTANAEIVALSKPKTVFRYMSFAFAALLLSPILGLISQVWRTLPLVNEARDVLLILTAFFSTVAIYTALYFYRSAPEKMRSVAEITN
ncbi:MAG TPA: hypothetical protein VED17_03015 [Nitrososphaerales archaeon]|nr:hypothetical protein [Nitrososphaerales archaeon]